MSRAQWECQHVAEYIIGGRCYPMTVRQSVTGAQWYHWLVEIDGLVKFGLEDTENAAKAAAEMAARVHAAKVIGEKSDIDIRAAR